MQQWAWAVRHRDNHTCAYCGSVERIEAHHIKPRRTHPELALVVDNGISLCHECHLRVHGGCYNPGAKPVHNRFTSEYCEPVKIFVGNYTERKNNE